MGMIALIYFLVGCTQVFGGLLRLATSGSKSKDYKSNLTRYIVIVAFYFIVLFFLTELQASLKGNNSNLVESFIYIHLGGVSAIIAIYYWYIVYFKVYGPSENLEVL